MMVRPNVSIEEHPDVAEMRARYDRLGQTTVAQVIDGLTLLAGTWLAISPFVVGFRPAERDLALNNLICGIVVAVLALAYATNYGRTHGLNWVVPLVGIWTIVSTWAAQGTDVAGGTMFNNIVTGLVITLLGLAQLAVSRERHRQPRRA
jgi:hypothetical protein